MKFNHFSLYIFFLLFTISASAQTKSFHNLSKYEKHWAIWHPFASVKLKNHQTEMYAIYKEVKQRPLYGIDKKI